MDKRDECKRSADEASKTGMKALKTGVFTLSREQHGRLPTYWPCGCPVYRRHDSYLGFRTELENRVGDAKGKGASGEPTRPKVPMHRSGAHCFVRAMKRGNARWSKGGRPPTSGWSQRETGGTPCLDGRRQPSLGGTSRMNREVHVRICGGLGVKVPGSTRQS